MTTDRSNRRNFLSTAVAVFAVGTTPLLAASPDVQAGAEGFLKAWVTAWNKRDAHALAALHTADCVTVNRYGTLIPDRTSAEGDLAFLLGPQGPFGDTTFPPAGTPSWTEIAYAAEYHDQMHMIRDMRAFAGDAPVRAFAQMEPEHLSRLGL